MLYTADPAKAADRSNTQYFEMFGNRAIYRALYMKGGRVHHNPSRA